jgi:YggT family protein
MPGRFPTFPADSKSSENTLVEVRFSMLQQIVGLGFSLLAVLVQFVILILVVQAVISWLIAFDVVDRRNNAINTIDRITRQLTEPMLRPIRNRIGPIGGIDLSPMILGLGLLFGLELLRIIVTNLLFSR